MLGLGLRTVMASRGAIDDPLHGFVGGGMVNTVLCGQDTLGTSQSVLIILRGPPEYMGVTVSCEQRFV